MDQRELKKVAAINEDDALMRYELNMLQQDELEEQADIPKRRRRIEFGGEEEEMIRILKKPYRTAQEIMLLEERTKDLKYFEQFNKVTINQKSHLHRKICKYLTLEYLPKGRVVFYEGDEANNFYILLKGRASVLLKKNMQPNNLSNSSNPLNLNETLLFHRINENRKGMSGRRSLQINMLQLSNTPLMKMLRIRLFHKIVWRLINLQRFIKYATPTKKKNVFKQNFHFPHRNSFISKAFFFSNNQQLQQQQQQQQQSLQLSQQIHQNNVSDFNLQQSNQPLSLQSNISLHQNPSISQRLIHVPAVSHNNQISSFDQQNWNNSQITIESQQQPVASLINFQQTQMQYSLQQFDDINTNQLGQPPDFLNNNQQQQQQQYQLQQQASLSQPSTHQSFKMNMPLVVEPQTTIGQQWVQNNNQMQQSLNIYPSSQQNIQLSQSVVPIQSSSQLSYGAFGIRSYGNDRFQKLRKEILENVHPELDITYLENVARFFNKQFQCFQYIAGKVFEKGDSFGELALVNSKPRSATIVCLQDSYFATLSKKHYNEILKEVEKQQILKRVDFLSLALLPKQNLSSESNSGNTESTKDFSNLSSSIMKLNKIQVSFTKFKYVAGHYLQKQGQPITKVYIVKKGEVNCSMKFTSTSFEITEIQLAIFQKCECIGAEELLLLLEEIDIAKKQKEKQLQERIEKGEEISEDEDEQYFSEDTFSNKNQGSKKQQKFVSNEKIVPISYTTSQVKSQKCSLLGILVTDFCRFLDDFPEMKLYLTKVAKSRRIWIDQRKREQAKIFRKLGKEQFEEPLSIQDSSFGHLQSPTLLRRTFLQNSVNNESKAQNERMKQNNFDTKVMFNHKKLSSLCFEQKANNHESNNQIQQDKQNNERQEMVQEYFQKQLKKVDTWEGGALTQMAKQKQKLTKEVIRDQQSLIQEGLALKYGYLHTLSNQKIKSSQVVDFIFNHEESIKQMSIAETAVEGQMTYCGVIQGMEKGNIKLKERNDQIKQKEVSKVVKPARVDYTTLGYSDELIKRMKKKQDKISKQQKIQEDKEKEKIKNETKIAESQQIEPNLKQEINKGNTGGQNKTISAKGTESKGNHLTFVQRMMLPCSKDGNSNIQTPQIIKRKHRMTDRNGNLIKKKLFIPLEPQQVKQNIKMNQIILKETQQHQRSFRENNPTSAQAQLDSECQIPSIVFHKYPNLKNSRLSKKIFDMIFSKSIFSPLPQLPSAEEEASIQEQQFFSRSQSSPSIVNKFPTKLNSTQLPNGNLNKPKRKKSLLSHRILSHYCESPPHLRNLSPQSRLSHQQHTAEQQVSKSLDNSFQIAQINNENVCSLNQKVFSHQNIISNLQNQETVSYLVSPSEFSHRQEQYQNKSLQTSTHCYEEKEGMQVIPNPNQKSQVSLNISSKNDRDQTKIESNNEDGSVNNNIRISQFVKLKDDSKKKLNSIISRLSTQANFPSEMINCKQPSNKKEVNIHLNKKNSQTKSLLWNSHRMLKSSQNDVTNISEQQPPINNIFHMISSQKDLCFPQSKPSTSNSDFYSAPQILSAIQIPSSTPSLVFQDKVEKSGFSQDKLVILTHMGKPLKYLYSFPKALQSPKQNSHFNFSISPTSQTQLQQRTGTSKGRPKLLSNHLHSSQSKQIPQGTLNLILQGKDFLSIKH